MANQTKTGVLFVCLGNICRSPIAEVVFNKLIKERNLTETWFCDSAALGDWHVGELPDHRALEVLKENGLSTEHRARQLIVEDFSKFDYIFGMDEENIREINKRKPKSGSTKAKIELLGLYNREASSKIIEDPYYKPGKDAFYVTYEECLSSCRGFLDQIVNQ